MCGDLCDAECPEPQVCVIDSAFVCYDRSIGGCDFDSLTLTREYCSSGEVCATRSDRPAMGSFGGGCFGAEYCREAAELGLRQVCVYSDGSLMEEGPPDEGACPPAPDEMEPFCGGSCGACPAHEPASGALVAEWFRSCLGINEEREFGVCAFDGGQPCRPGADSYALYCPRYEGRPCACIVFRDPDGTLREAGNTTFVESCLAYRERYPDAVECLDPVEWTPL